MSENVVDWLLDAIVTEWPEAEFPGDVYRVNRDEPRILETGERTRSVELTQAAAIGAARGNPSREAIGVSYNFSVETPVTIRIEGLHADEYGTVQSDSEFQTLVANVKEAIKRVRKHPTIDGGAIDYHTVTIENEEDSLANFKDHFRSDLTVVFSGYELRDD